MGIFRSKKSTRNITTEPLPDWDDTRWRSHLRSNALGIDHHCGLYVESVNDARKEAALHFKNDDQPRARSLAESALRNNRIVTALAALSPVCNALFQRSEPLAGYTSLVQIPEPARSGIVSIIFSAGRLQMSFLTDTVNFLREQFGTVHIDQIQKAQGDLYPHVNATVRDALSAVPPTRQEVDTELASAVKQFFGISIQSSSNRTHRNQQTSPPAQDMRRSQTTSLSALSSDMGAPVSPQLSREAAHPSASASTQQHERALKTPSPPRPADPRYASKNGSQLSRYASPGQGGYSVGVAERLGRPEGLAATVDVPLKRGRTVPVGHVVEKSQSGPSRPEFLSATVRAGVLDQDDRNGTPRGETDRNMPHHLMIFEDSDDMLLGRYEHLREVISA